jgi:hypothetical protein
LSHLEVSKRKRQNHFLVFIRRAAHVTRCAGWLLISSLLGQISCLVANHWLLAASVVAQPSGALPSPRGRRCCAVTAASGGASGISYGWLK